MSEEQQDQQATPTQALAMEINTLKSRVTSLENEPKPATYNDSELQEQVASLQEQVTKLRNMHNDAVQTVQKVVNKLKATGWEI